MKQKINNSRRKTWSIITISICCLLLFIAFLAFFSAQWYINTYNQSGFEAIMFTLLSDLNGVESDLVIRYIIFSVMPAILCTALLGLIFFVNWKKKLTIKFSQKFQMTLFPVRRAIAIFCTVVFSLGFLYWAASLTHLKEYLVYASKETTIFQDEYIDPQKTEITFPEKKRNLIYIFMESMETTFFSTEQGGRLETGVIPELYDLVKKNISFSCNDGGSGLYASSGSNWTIGAMVAQTAGIPLKVSPGAKGNDFGQNGVFLPGITSLTDILHNNGYYQTLMVGSDSVFGGRKAYFEEHSIDYIYDINTARKDGTVEPDYYVWWGMEDSNLYRYAKQELGKISEKEQPFAFYMLTVDTHNIGGYVCPYCDNKYENQYENVLACASKQLNDFVKWLKKQDFYKDTSIIIVGDHTTMDSYINDVDVKGYSRGIYNCFINSSVTPYKPNGRVAFSIDMFPTTLASMGCTIKGDRLGLGTNLFSNTPTLAEKLNKNYLNDEFKKYSSYYNKRFLLNE